MNIPPFINPRWLITGTLTTETELHIGDGSASEIHDRNRAKQKEMESDASTVCVDCQGRVFLPGSSLKGVLRARIADELEAEKRALEDWWRSNKLKKVKQRDLKPFTPWTQLFGFEDSDSGAAVGGKLVFFDAFHAERPDSDQLDGRVNESDNWNANRLNSEQNSDRNQPYWDPIRRTCVAVSVSLDRRTRAAKENFLYHIEYVPPGETFLVEIGGEDLTDEDVARTLNLMETFNSPTEPRTTLGALESNGWGGMKWQPNENASCLAKTKLNDWVENPAAGFAACVEKRNVEQLKEKAIPFRDTRERILINLSLTMESPWLIRDARQSERVEAFKGPQEEKPPDAIPIHDEQRRACVPAKSLRGALRSRAEMILRTLALNCGDHPNDLQAVSTKHRRVESPTEESISLSELDKALKIVSDVDLASRLFGFSGWQAPLCVPRLISNESPPEHQQEFVAIDRFTGSAADKFKFNAELAGRTTVTGSLTLDLSRLQRVDGTAALMKCDLCLISVSSPNDIPSTGKNLIVIAMDAGDRIAIRIFDGQGFMIADKGETDLSTESQKIEAIKRKWAALKDRDNIQPDEKRDMLAFVSAAAGFVPSLGLLALVLRDLHEGDLSIGSGSAKGQGYCAADATIKENGVAYPSLKNWFQHSSLLQSALAALHFQTS